MRVLRGGILVFALGAMSTPATAAPILIDFETLLDFEDVTTQFSGSGITFTGATALLSGALGGSLNETDFPPSSGDVVVFDLGGEIRVDFASGATSVSGRFTYAAPVTLTAYSGATVLGSVTSLFDNNGAFSGNPANELLQFAFAGGISHITLVGAVLGGSFVLDDFFADTVDDAPVPEPGTASLLLLGAAVLVGRRGRLIRGRQPEPE